MKRILLVCMILSLLFSSVAYAKTTGPLWAVWTHSKDINECRIKTSFWFTLGTATAIYLSRKSKKPDKEMKWFPSIVVHEGNTFMAINFRF